MDWYHIVLRVVHILAGVFWAGSFYFFFLFVEPSVKELGATGQQFVGHISDKKKLPVFMAAAAGLTILAGILLYWRDSGGFDLDWITSGPGIAFTVGGLTGTFAFLAGVIFTRPAIARMTAIGKEVGASGGPPSAAQMTEIERLTRRMTTIGRLDFVLITVAILMMATARFL